MSLGVYPGRYPAIVETYDQAKRTCRVKIPGITDGGDVLPEAEIEYPIGDKAKDGQFTTEIEILPGDTVWIAFLAGDPRYPIITGWRNPQAGNSLDWRRWHHKNIELIADEVMHHIVGGSETTHVPDSITEKTQLKTTDAPQTHITGNVQIDGNTVIDGNLLVKGKITGQSGMAISGGGGATVDGEIKSTGDMVAGSVSVQGHTHTGDSGGSTSAPN